MSKPTLTSQSPTTHGAETSVPPIAALPNVVPAQAAALMPPPIVPQPTPIPIDPAPSKAVMNPSQIQRTKFQNIPAFLNKLYKCVYFFFSAAIYIRYC